MSTCILPFVCTQQQQQLAEEGLVKSEVAQVEFQQPENQQHLLQLGGKKQGEENQSELGQQHCHGFAEQHAPRLTLTAAEYDCAYSNAGQQHLYEHQQQMQQALQHHHQQQQHFQSHHPQLARSPHSSAPTPPPSTTTLCNYYKMQQQIGGKQILTIRR